MNRKPVSPNRENIPAEFHALLDHAAVYDSSCSKEAQVLYIEKDGGYFLKSAPKGALQKEADLTRFFHQKKLAAEVLAYVTEEKDWLLTERVAGEDCTHAAYLEDPKRLCDTTAELLRMLHETDTSGCPVNRTEDYLATIARNHRAGVFDASWLSEEWRLSSAEEAWNVVECNAAALNADTLLHGDYCLPNIMLKDWRFSGFIDLDCGGVGDKHIDLFWGVWTLLFNLKTNQYQQRFMDAYGRSAMEPELLRVIAAAEMFG